MNQVMEEKGRQAVLCYDALKEALGIEPETEVLFNLDPEQEQMFRRACRTDNPFPGILKLVLLSLRQKAVGRLYEPEKVLQTGPAAAVLALDRALSVDIGKLRCRMNGVSPSAGDSPVLCDVGFAGLQVIRLYMIAYSGSREFVRARYDSAIRVDNALNGSFYKYQTKDGRMFSAHVYYESQKRKMMETLGITKDPDRFVFSSLLPDRRLVARAAAKWNAEDLEEAVFANGACGCMIRDRKEWESMPVGKAVDAMPLFRLTKTGDCPVRNFGPADQAGEPLKGLKVLDLTHIIAGPVCTRLLAEQGADVLLVRRGTFMHQEQAMLELDGWAGKRSIQLDFNDPAALARMKELVREADVVVSSYQSGALDHFGLSEEDIHRLNPHVIYGYMVCFSDSVWKTRPGWAPCAEDITGLSVRNGTKEHPVNLNGVPLDYIPGMILCAGILTALRHQMTEGGSYTVAGSLTRGGYWLHECTDLWEEKGSALQNAASLSTGRTAPVWQSVYHRVRGTSVGDVLFPAPATYVEHEGDVFGRMAFTDGADGFRE